MSSAPKKSPETGPVRPTDDDARALARDLIQRSRFAALAYHDPDTQCPMVARIACVPDPNGSPMSLVSDLSGHTRALRADPNCAFLIGEPGDKGDPLTHPRLSLQGQVRFVRHDHPDHADLSQHYLQLYPKAKLYIGFGDFSFLKLTVTRGFLNGGFGKAFDLTAQDLTLKHKNPAP